MDYSITHSRNIYIGGRQSILEKKKFIEKVNEQLIGLADVFSSMVGCIGFWGEVEVPECMQRELEEKEEQE